MRFLHLVDSAKNYFVIFLGQPHSISFVGLTRVTAVYRLRKMSLYSKGLLLIFLRPNFLPSLKNPPAIWVGFLEGKKLR